MSGKIDGAAKFGTTWAIPENAVKPTRIGKQKPERKPQILKTELVEIADTYIKNNIRWRVVLDGSIQRKGIPEIPMDAVREALVNSYCHRLYTSSQNNEITIYSNRVEIYNPGACDEAGVKVEFQLLKKGFAVVFYRPGEQFNTTEKVSDVVINVTTNVVLNKPEQTALSIIKENPLTTAEQLAARLSKSSRMAQRYLDSLQKKECHPAYWREEKRALGTRAR